jgi:hypothetical protein
VPKVFFGIIIALFLVSHGGIAGCRAHTPEFPAYPTPEQEEYAQKLIQLGEPLDKYPQKEVQELVELPRAKGNAAEHYTAAFKLYSGEKDENGRVSPDAEGVELVLKGTRIRVCQLMPDFLIVTAPGGPFPPPSLELAPPWFYALSLAELAQEKEQDGDAAAVEDLYKRMVIFGHHLACERAGLNQVLIGLKIEITGAEKLSVFFKSTKNENGRVKAESLVKALAAYRKGIFMKLHLLSRIENRASLKACIHVLENDREPVWRIEACHTLGILKTPGFTGKMRSLAADALAKVVENDNDLLVREWAVWCFKNITGTSLGKQGGSSSKIRKLEAPEKRKKK